MGRDAREEEASGGPAEAASDALLTYLVAFFFRCFAKNEESSHTQLVSYNER